MSYGLPFDEAETIEELNEKEGWFYHQDKNQLLLHVNFTGNDLTLLINNVNVSNNIELQEAPQSLRLLQPYPNPFNHSLRVPIEVSQAGHYTVSAESISGYQVLEFKVFLERPGHHVLNMEKLFYLSPGMYILSVKNSGGDQAVKKIIKY
jgi:hypothetical protein